MFSVDKVWKKSPAHQHYSKMGREEQKQHGYQKPPIVFMCMCVCTCVWTIAVESGCLAWADTEWVEATALDNAAADSREEMEF